MLRVEKVDEVELVDVEYSGQAVFVGLHFEMVTVLVRDVVLEMVVVCAATDRMLVASTRIPEACILVGR